MDEDAEIYGSFAGVYDRFMDNIPYDDWHDYLLGLLQEQGISQGILVELACGTGSMTARLAADGYDMIGIDQSVEMLEIARQKCPENVLLLQQDMRELDLYGSAAAFVCICDGMNYILTEEELQRVFRQVKLFLDDEGVFIFDMKTEYFYRESLGSCIITDHREDSTLIWENEYHPESGINEYMISIYQLADEERNLFSREEEYHRQRAYAPEEIKRLLEAEGLYLCAVYEAMTKKVPAEDSERIYFIIKKHRER